jgi:hypothetical protein
VKYVDPKLEKVLGETVVKQFTGDPSIDAIKALIEPAKYAIEIAIIPSNHHTNSLSGVGLCPIQDYSSLTTIPHI